MTTLNFNIDIKAPAQKVWQILWNDSTYRKWTRAFQEGSYAVTDWKEGSKVQFLSPSGEGMFSLIEKNKPNEYMAFKHLGVIKDFKEQPENEETKTWKGAMETYSLKEKNGNTSLEVTFQSTDQYLDYFKTTFPKALQLIKEIAEQPIQITVEATVSAPVDKVWKFWTMPEHITKWNNASEDWHTPRAENDLRVGGKFNARMEAKDGSFGFDFGGVYDEVKSNETIAYTIGDGRKVKVRFAPDGNKTKVSETFEAETMNPIDMQQGGWQAILNNFKKYTEIN
jgi:uncharacterized protein YndB with AHSA1/START domain